jgi:hypothetical protein
LGGHWNENRSSSPLGYQEFFDVLALVAEAAVDDDVSTLARMASPRAVDNGQRQHLLTLLEDRTRLTAAFSREQPGPEAEWVLLIARTLTQFQDIVRWVRSLGSSHPPLAPALGMLYGLIAGPMNHELGAFLNDAATRLRIMEDSLRDGPFPPKPHSRLSFDYAAGTLSESTEEKPLLVSELATIGEAEPAKIRKARDEIKRAYEEGMGQEA